MFIHTLWIKLRLPQVGVRKFDVNLFTECDNRMSSIVPCLMIAPHTISPQVLFHRRHFLFIFLQGLASKTKMLICS